MKNEYGVTLDRNGYAPSIIEEHSETCCWNCGRNGNGNPLNRHEVFYGPFREKSKRLGLWVYLCHNGCHQGRYGVHENWYADWKLKNCAQHAAMRHYHWSEEDFIREFGRSYINPCDYEREDDV